MQNCASKTNLHAQIKGVKYNMNLDVKKRIVKCLVWSIALYAAETWTMSNTDIKRIEAFEMWLWRKMEKISWRAKVSSLIQKC